MQELQQAVDKFSDTLQQTDAEDSEELMVNLEKLYKGKSKLWLTPLEISEFVSSDVNTCLRRYDNYACVTVVLKRFDGIILHAKVKRMLS